MIAYLMANYANILVSVIAIAEIVSIFLPNSKGTIAGLISAIASLPGVKDPGINGL